MSESGFTNPSDEKIEALLRHAGTVAVVGLSDKPDRPSHGVARSLQSYGYRIVPVNPGLDRVLGETAVPSLNELPGRVDIVDVFRHPRHVPEIVDQCIELGLPALWLQEGVVDAASAQRARDAGLTVVMDRCMYREYNRLLQ